MADEESRDDGWGNKVAGVTWFWTMILAVAFVGVVFVFILR
jgi:hypothetical protein